MLQGKAWDLVEDLDITSLGEADGYGKMFACLDSGFKYESMTELPDDFENFFVKLQRRPEQTLQYSADFARAHRKLRSSHKVELPEKVLAWWFIRKSGITREQSQMVLTTMGTEKMTVEAAQEAMFFIDEDFPSNYLDVHFLSEDANGQPVDVLLLGNNYAFDVANLDIGHGTVLRVATARSGSGSMTMPRHQVKKYIKYLVEKGVDMAEVEVYPCTKGFRYGNSQMEATKTCVVVPTYMGGKKRKMLVYVIGGTAPTLVGRPVLEKMGIAVDYGKNMMRWPDREWNAIKVGPKGEHSLHLAEDIKELKDAEVAEYLIPEGAEGHVDFKSNLGVQALLVAEDDNLEESYAVEPGTVLMDMDDVVDEGVSKEPSQQNAVGLDAGGIEDPKLTTPMLRKMIREAEEVVSSRNKILRMARTCEKGKPIRKIWEPFVGEGRASKFLDKMNGVESRVFSVQNGWNFEDKGCQKKFMELVKREEPDEILMAPMCRLWSPMQELYACRGEWENQQLVKNRTENHDNVLMFVREVYLEQYQNAREATLEHPWLSRAWKTKAWCDLPGHMAYVDQCMYGLTKMAEPRANLMAVVPVVDDVMAGEGAEEFKDEKDVVKADDEQADAQKREDESIKKNRRLRAEVGTASLQLREAATQDLGHPAPDVLCQMLNEVQATNTVLKAAKNYLCPSCVARTKPGGAPPASGLTAKEFNDRIVVDSAWINTDTGRKCVLTILDQATRYVAVRILKAGRAEELIKGIAKGWASRMLRGWASDKNIALEIAPAEAHNWLGAVERKHQVIRRALELFMEDANNKTEKGLLQASIYVPGQVNAMSMTRGFAPTQWVIGRSPNQVQSVTGDLFTPTVDALDAAGEFANVQKKRLAAQTAFIRADSDAKLRRAMNQNYRQIKDTVVVGQVVYWREKGVRPRVEDTGIPPNAALKDLQELRARSTTQLKDVYRPELPGDEEEDDIEELDAEYEPEEPGEPGESPEVDESMLLGIVVPLIRSREGRAGQNRCLVSEHLGEMPVNQNQRHHLKSVEKQVDKKTDIADDDLIIDDITFVDGMDPDVPDGCVMAKMEELENYFRNKVWNFAEVSPGDESRIVSTRWVLTWKVTENGPKAKARLVLRGYQDPDLIGLEKSAPTAGRLGKVFLMLFVQNLDWLMFVGDVRAAFLSGASFDRKILAKLPADCSALLGVRGQAYMRLLKSAYGLADAPLLWCREAIPSGGATDWTSVASYYGKADYALKVILIMHVDDVMCTQAREPEADAVVEEVRKNFDFGKWKKLSEKSPITYCGCQISIQHGEINLDAEEYLKQVKRITVDKNGTGDMTDREVSKARTAITELNKGLRFAKATAGVRLKFPSMVNNLDELCFVVFSDAAFGIRRDFSLQGGYILVAANKKLLDGERMRYTTLAWRSFKLDRVCRSSLSAESQACATATDELMITKLFYSLMLDPDQDLRSGEMVKKADQSAVVIDARALYDATTRDTIKNVVDKRAAVEILCIKEALEFTGSEMWVAQRDSWRMG
ncbi:unnamed protein product [Effrenium voratum]|nr:unnamed protein product [Effrenium voratum]